MDISVIRDAGEGDVKAFKKIFDYYLPRMRPVCLRYVQTNFEADDILQESFVKIYNNLKDFKFEGSFEGWVRRIVVNTALNHHKKYKNYTSFDRLEDIDEPDTEWDFIDEIEETPPSSLMKIIDLLPQGYKIVFNLYVFEDLSHKEIGNLLEISEGSSRSQYSKAKKMIKKLMSRQRIEEKSSLIGKEAHTNDK
jgi:RNA polymerase sigma-70 factor (ECF subfamily)